MKRFLSHFVLSTLGVFMPVCECGNVPVVRRLVMKGFSVSQSITFLLAAPIVNPITLYSTLAAFSFEPAIAAVRIVAALVIANMVGLIFSLKRNQHELLTAKFYQLVCGLDHEHKHGRLAEGLQIFQQEFVTVMRMLVFGALIATATQTLIPREWITTIGSDPLLSILAMLILAFVISICANVDAFFALSYASTFTVGSLLTFLIFGPMIDIKMLAMLKTTFSTQALVSMSVLVGLSSILVGLLVNLVW
ncbi:MAG: permease [Candidatus Dojkabacteria bacterium]